LSPERGEAREDAPIRSQITRAVFIEVERVRQCMQRWRQERAAGAPIPSALWAAAANAARRHGVSRTTRALGLDYNKLKLRVQEGAPVEPARFMELAPPAPAARAASRSKDPRERGSRSHCRRRTVRNWRWLRDGGGLAR